MSLTPKIVPKTIDRPPPKEERQAVELIRDVIIKETVTPTGWRFVPHRDENNLIVEIIATPIL